MQNPHFKSKFKIPKNMLNSILKIICICCLQKTAPLSTKCPTNETILKNRQSWKGYSPCKILIFGQKLKFKKHLKSHATNHLLLFCAKNASKKHHILDKRHHFKNRPLCKGYSPCKILILSQNLKFQKTCQNPF